jgi:hypothetical protein
MPRFERHGTAPGVPGPVKIFTDAVVISTRGIYGMAFISTDGTYGMRLGDQPRIPNQAAVDDAKIRAISYAMKRTPALPPPISITSDSMMAVAAYNLWRANPQSRNIPPLLLDLRPPPGGRDRYTFAWAPEDADDPLTSWADSAARLALRIESGLVERRAAATILDEWARARLSDWGRARNTKD